MTTKEKIIQDCEEEIRKIKSSFPSELEISDRAYFKMSFYKQRISDLKRLINRENERPN